jgi:putative FmdB family regulatory protein
MPIYEYTCSQCQKVSDVLQKLNEPAPEKCPACGAEGSLSRIVSRTSFVLKGGGWGADLYGSKKAADKADSAPAEGAKASDKTAPPAAGAAPAAASSTPAASTSSAPSPSPSSTATPAKKDGGS